MASVLGIDFGTSNSGAAWLDEKGRARIAAVRDGVYLLPSVAWYGPAPGGGVSKNALVGQPAREQLIQDPMNTVVGLKRFLGRRWDSPYVHQHKDRFAWEIVPGPDGLCAAKLGDEVKPLEDVAVDILKRLLELAVISHHAPFSECVLTVPAHFGFSQRNALRRAAQRAGLKVRGMVNEPTAAAMYYARKKGNDGTVLVFDLGGGTFDATLMAIVGGVVKVIATGGDAFLGGTDFDTVIVDHLIEGFANQHKIDLKENAIGMQRLYVAAEAAKIELSRQPEVRLRVPCVAMQGERFLDLETRLSRETVEALSTPLVERCITVCKDILVRAKLEAIEVDEIVFVGGMTRMPLIHRKLAEIFVANPAKNVHPDLGVVVGAALLSDDSQSLIDVVSMSIGITLPGGVTREILPANTSVPSVKRIPLERPAKPGMPLVFALFEAVDATSLDRDILGTVRVPADFIDKVEGPLELEAFVSADLDITMFAIRSDGEKLPLLLETPQSEAAKATAAAKADKATTGADKPAAPREVTMIAKAIVHPGFRSVAVTTTDLTAEGPAARAEGKLDDKTDQEIRRKGTTSSDPSGNKSGSSSEERAAIAERAKPPPLPSKKSKEAVAAIVRIPVEPLERSDKPSTGAEGSSEPDEPAPPQPGDSIGPYELLDLLGQGGMGRVYLAEHKRLSRRVALKMLRRRFAQNRPAVERFLSEARAVNQIRHENIIEVTDVFDTDDGRTCTIMEVLEGRSLAGLLRSVGAVQPERAVRIAFQVANALVSVHDAQIVHRDLKPENIFLTQRAGRRDFVKLLDFGVAKLVDVEGQSLHDTGVGMRVGTLDYMPPEQLMGQVVDHRADVFALGVVLYESLTGRLPFGSGKADRELLYSQISEPRVPPSQVEKLEGIEHVIPPALDALILQCLEAEPNNRPQSMREIAGRLEAIAEQLVAEVSPPAQGPASSGVSGPAARSGEFRMPGTMVPILDVEAVAEKFLRDLPDVQAVEPASPRASMKPRRSGDTAIVKVRRGPSGTQVAAWVGAAAVTSFALGWFASTFAAYAAWWMR